MCSEECDNTKYKEYRDKLRQIYQKEKGSETCEDSN